MHPNTRSGSLGSLTSHFASRYPGGEWKLCQRSIKVLNMYSFPRRFPKSFSCDRVTNSSIAPRTSQLSYCLSANMSEFKEDDNGLRREETHESVLERVRSAGLLTISPEMFEKLYLNPKTSVKGDLRSTFGNPTPLWDPRMSNRTREVH